MTRVLGKLSDCPQAGVMVMFLIEEWPGSQRSQHVDGEGFIQQGSRKERLQESGHPIAGPQTFCLNQWAKAFAAEAS